VPNYHFISAFIFVLSIKCQYNSQVGGLSVFLRAQSESSLHRFFIRLSSSLDGEETAARGKAQCVLEDRNVVKKNTVVW